ncbi:acyltransferase [Pseudoalteromonas sp. Angola-7]|uniref:acyltransferase family protein n=1 Tax=Pseudoalteromonas sp. Angola-7 TaxID=3025336 RepID=UPI00235881C1|nr:acyltransferase [Pseudoalteromonas sp. Angola-7]MDC9529387.1 acyltransferase [Pseudoalteromonas sp. Angola-7]
MKLLILQFLRGWAAIIVVAYHAHGVIIKRHVELGAEHSFWFTENQFVKIGAIGVDIFFILSGFIIFYTSRNSFDVILYLKKRAVRIYPIWFIAILFMTVLALLPGSSAVFDLEHIFYSSLLIPHIYDGAIVPFLKVGWTLNYEIIFYLLFAPTLYFSSSKRLEIITVMIVCLSIISHFLSENIGVIRLLQNPILFEFLIGGWLAKLYLTGFNISKKLMYLVSTFGLLWLGLYFFTPYIWEYNSLISRAPIALSIFIVSIFYTPIRNIKIKKSFVYLGDASYSIYLFHMFPIMILSGVLGRNLIPQVVMLPTFLVWLIITAGSVLFGCIIYNIIEKKINIRLKEYVSK